MRLIHWLYRTLFGLHVRSNAQHIADLQHYLTELSESRQAIDAEIDSAMNQLLAAMARRDELAKPNPPTFAGRRATDFPQTSLEEA